MFSAAKKQIVGLDVGSRAVKMVSLRSNGDGFHVTAAGLSEVDAAQGGKDPSHRALTAAIEECLRSSGGGISRNSHFVFGLSGPKVKVSSFNFASLTLDEVADAVMFEAAQICPFDIRDSVVDYQLIGMEDVGGGIRKKKKVYPNVRGVLAVADKGEVSHKRILAKEALLKCVLMDSDGLALLNCLEEYRDDEELPIAVINIGMSLTTVAILGSDGLPFIRDLKYCGSDVVDNLGKESSEEDAADIHQACRRLIRDINETLSYYSTHQGNDTLKHVYVCGGFSLFEDCVKILTDGIDSEVSVWNPFIRIKCDDNIAGSELINDNGPAFVVAAGLAMRQV